MEMKFNLFEYKTFSLQSLFWYLLRLRLYDSALLLQSVEIDMMMTWLSPLEPESPATSSLQVGKEESKQLADAGTPYQCSGSVTFETDRDPWINTQD
jgi:hypothetical protein